MGLLQRNSRGQLYGFPIDIRIPYMAKSLGGGRFKSSWTLFCAGRNYWGDVILIVCGVWLTLAEGEAPIEGDQC